jgi:acetyltransferase-like isoleucine patch superfamily enzyme
MQRPVPNPSLERYDEPVLGEFVLLDVAPSSPAGASPMPTRFGSGALIRSHSVIYAGSVIGRRFQAGHGVLVRESCVIGDDVSIGSHSVVEHHVTLGHRVRIHTNAFVPEFTIVEDDAWIGPNVVFTNARYPKSRDAKQRLVGATVRRGAKIGAGAVLLPGVIVGENALVGAGSVVVKDVPPNKIIAGSPARVLRDLGEVDVYQNSAVQGLVLGSKDGT